MTVSLPAADGTMTEYTAFDTPFYIANVQYAAMLTDYVEGSLKGWNLSSAYKDLAAITYAGTTKYTYEGAEYDAEMFLVLGADGTLHQFIAFASEYTDENGLGYVMARGTMGNIGMEFGSHRALTMTLVDTETAFGLLIGDASQGYADLYFADLSGETMTCGKVGRVPGATVSSHCRSVPSEYLPAVCHPADPLPYPPFPPGFPFPVSVPAVPFAGCRPAANWKSA